MSIIAGFMVPHPPMIVPAIGRGSEAQVEETTHAYERVADEIAEIQPDTIIISSPHTVMYADYFHISPGAEAQGDFGDFGAPQVKFDEEYDSELVSEICREADEVGFRAGTFGERDRSLDHATMVPLWFIRNKYKGGKIIRVGLSGQPLTDHYMLGMMIQKAVDKLGRRAVYVASGDLSHKLQDYGPYGFAPEGPVYDERIMDVMGRGAFGELFDFDESFCEKAAECGHRSFVIMAGALDGLAVRVEKFSHQDVTGVGYGICSFHTEAAEPDGADDSNGPRKTDESRRFLGIYLDEQEKKSAEQREHSDEYVKLARKSLESYIRDRKVISVPEGLPKEMLETQAGAFVSIHEHGALRGCIGTILPTTSCVAQEIIDNAVSASTRDPRFDPITEEELRWLDINVDVLSEPEDIESADELDVRKYGVIVSSGMKRGLLLPDLDGVDTVEQQISIAMRKGGIEPGEKIKLQRFTVTRHV